MKSIKGTIISKKYGIKVGDIFETRKSGKYKINSFCNTKYILIKFLETKSEKIVRMQEILSKSIRDNFKRSYCDIGFFGDGFYGKRTSEGAYAIWRCMIERCYGENSVIESPSYINCIVCDEWHNFQNFAQWFIMNKDLDYHLDKDLKLVY